MRELSAVLELPHVEASQPMFRQLVTALIVEDVGRYPTSKIGDIYERIGPEISRSHIQRGVAQLVKADKLIADAPNTAPQHAVAGITHEPIIELDDINDSFMNEADSCGVGHEWAIGQTAPYRQ